jgi:dipeptidyl aminopeptidase/acylaminoacyl peptidase
VVPAENSIDLAAALRRVKVPVELLIVEKDGHGYGLGRVPESARWKQSFLTWLDRTFMQSSPNDRPADK